jgi:hypothetical protein
MPDSQRWRQATRQGSRRLSRDTVLNPLRGKYGAPGIWNRTYWHTRLPNLSLPVSFSPGLQTHSLVLLSGVVPSPQDQTQRPSGATTWYGFGQSGALLQMRLPNLSLPVSFSPGLQTHSLVLLSGVVPSPQDQTQRPSCANTWYGAGHAVCALTCIAFVKNNRATANKSQETRCFFITDPS